MRGKVAILTGANSGMGKETKLSFNEGVARRLWQVSAELTHLTSN